MSQASQNDRQLPARVRKTDIETRASGRLVPRNDDWDVITATADGGVIWKRYSDGSIVVTRAGETPHGQRVTSE